MFSPGQTVYVSAQKATIMSVEAGKRGRTMVTVELESGRAMKVDSRSVELPPEFAPPCSTEELLRPLQSSEHQLRASYRRTSTK